MDVVFTHVDGENEEYRRVYLAQTNTVDVEDVRCVSHGEILLAVRLVLLHMPWIRAIYIVHAGSTTKHAAELMAMDARVCLVPQAVILPPAYHNTVCSCTVEAYIHCIPRLSSYFIYMNDDMFIGRPLARAHWINGRVRYIDVSLRRSRLDGNEAQRHNTNAMELFLRRFGPIAGPRRFEVSHHAALVSRAACELAHRMFELDIAASCSIMCRSGSTLNFQLLAALMAHHHGLGVLRYRRTVRIPGWSEILCHGGANDLECYDFIEANRPHMFCINGVTRDTEPHFRTMAARYLTACKEDRQHRHTRMSRRACEPAVARRMLQTRRGLRVLHLVGGSTCRQPAAD